jgi:hypothetical protein
MFISSCASEKPRFNKEKVCSNESLKYLRNPRNISKRAPQSPGLIQAMAKSSKGMQACYEDFKNRTGYEEFNTCLVVGVSEDSTTEFYNFSSQEIVLDQKFLSCARTVTKSITFEKYGKNYILIQSYQFYVRL